MHSAAAIFLAAPGLEQGAPPSTEQPQADDDQNDFGMALRQMFAAVPACAPQPLPQPQLPAEAAAGGALVDARRLQAGASGWEQMKTDAALPAEGADGEGDALPHLPAQDESALSAMTQEQDATETKQQVNNARLFQEGRADKAGPPAMQNQAQQEAVLPAGVQEQAAEKIKAHQAGAHSATSAATASSAQAQPLSEQAAVHLAERPAPAEGVSRFEQTLSIVRDGSRLQVSLEPDGFGKLDINLSLEQGVLHARIAVADEAARMLLANHQQQILNALEKDGLNVGGFSVALRNNGSDGREQPERNSRNFSYPADDTTAAAAPGAGSGRISIFV